MTHLDGAWAGEIEIMAASAILNADIYVANDCYRDRFLHSKFSNSLKSSLLRAKPGTDTALYIKHFDVHYEPVISMTYCPSKTYGEDKEQIPVYII